MSLKIISNGREIRAEDFAQHLHQQVIDVAKQHLESMARGAAESIIDPATGKHPDVFIARDGDRGIEMSTSGSDELAREIERRLVGGDDTEMHEKQGAQSNPVVYLAHASEDKDALARPLANLLMQNGIETWFDEWEICAGDSLRRRMEDGLGKCTHFLVVLTPASVKKPWVQTEIDAGFVGMVGGQSRFIGVRSGVEVSELSPFLRTLKCPKIDLSDAKAVNELIGDIFGVSRKPQLGQKPRYVRTVPSGLGKWAASAVTVAEYLARNSASGRDMDPQVELASAAAATGLSEDDVSMAVLDLRQSGMIDVSAGLGGPTWFWPKARLFVEFDRHFMDFDPKYDAVAIATWLVNEKVRGIGIEELAAQFQPWSARRLNSALNYLSEVDAVDTSVAIDSTWACVAVMVTDKTRRFVRDNH